MDPLLKSFIVFRYYSLITNLKAVMTSPWVRVLSAYDDSDHQYLVEAVAFHDGEKCIQMYDGDSLFMHKSMDREDTYYLAICRTDHLLSTYVLNEFSFVNL